MAQRLAIIGFSSSTLAGCASVPAPKNPRKWISAFCRALLLPLRRASGGGGLRVSRPHGAALLRGQPIGNKLLHGHWPGQRYLSSGASGPAEASAVPVERIGLDHLLKERQLIRSTQQEFGRDPNLPALLFAGVTRGSGHRLRIQPPQRWRGARYLGVGADGIPNGPSQRSAAPYQHENGEVLITTETSATIFSYQVSSNLFRLSSKRKSSGSGDRHGL